MEKPKVLSRIKNNHFDRKGGGACEDIHKVPSDGRIAIDDMARVINISARVCNVVRPDDSTKLPR